jgi:sodium/hydrogen antiporter
VGVQVFAIAVNLPKAYMRHHWKGVAMLVGPVMAFSWLITALFIYLLFRTDFATALVISACLAPTDPVLAASVLGNSRFSTRIPRRIRNVLGAESGCNDGTSFPFLYAGLQFIRKSGAGIALKEWFLITILWQCCFGLFLGVVVGRLANIGLKLASQKKYIEHSSFFAFYLLLALFTVGLGSTLGVDDFLVAFGAGTAFSWDGWFSSRTREMVLPQVLDLLFNSSMFVYFGSIIPWTHFVPRNVTPDVTPVRLLALLVLVLLFRRIPIILALKPFIPDIKTYREALFCGHVGPMGLGALFLSMEARAYLENGSAIPSPHPPKKSPYLSSIELIWPVTCFVVLGSVLVHGLSVLIISVGAHYLRGKEKRDNVIGGEDDPLEGMIRESEGSESDDGSAEERPDLDEADERAFDGDGRLRL